MHILVVVNDPEDWHLSIPGVELVAARRYLADARYSAMSRVKVFNLCRCYRYQYDGYYVSLLAEARGHRPLPTITTIQDMKLPSLAKVYSQELDRMIQSALRNIKSKKFVLSCYFGRNLAKRYHRLCQALFALFPAPLLRAYFQQEDNGLWRLLKMGTITTAEVPASHMPFVETAANHYFTRRYRQRSRRVVLPYSMAILYDHRACRTPSNDRAIALFVRAAKKVGIDAEVVDCKSLGQLSDYDALFIRETTAVNHHTYRLARRAAAEGLVVIDDPDSILRCTNKVYLAQALQRHRIWHPKTMLIHRENRHMVAKVLGLPCVLKKPDGSFSQGVIKVDTPEMLQAGLQKLLRHSEMVVGQEFLPTEFDWRVGILDGEPLYVCRYHMVKDHWQIVQVSASGKSNYGKMDALAVDEAPKAVLAVAKKAANLIGSSLYGVDVKQIGQRCYVIEVNDNPNIDAGYEDAVLQQTLYDKVMESFLRKIENRHHCRSVNE